jgi:hypothetical protein
MTAVSSKYSHLWAIAFALLALLVAVSTQSLWIDEAIAAKFAMCPTFSAWFHSLAAARGSDPQMPLYLLWLWSWDKIFGHGEYALRMAGYPFLALGVIAFSWRRPACALACGLSAFAWYYANEARPYSMQIGLSLAIIGSAMRLAEGRLTPRSEMVWQMILVLSGTILGMIYMLGMFWTAAYWTFCLLCIPSLRRREVLKKTLPAWLGAFSLLLVAGCYYLWTLKVGARATDVGATDFRNVFFDFYELLGFGGLGPGRLEIRESGLAAFMPYAPWLAFYGIFLAAVFFIGLKCLFQKLGWKRGTLVLLLALAAAAFILGVGVEKHFRVLGRHLTPMLPLLLWIVSEGVQSLWQKRGLIGRIIITGWAVLALGSCLEYRFAVRHAKDDYRSAAAVARNALKQHQIVWWNADGVSAWYYGVSVGDPNIPVSPSSGEAMYLFDPSLVLLQSSAAPDLVIASKPDIYDANGRLNAYLQANHYRREQTLPAFEIWEK